jgi:hypothetical protein
MILKQTLKTRPTVKLTFELPEELEADTLELVADFTGWKPVPFTRLKRGRWKLTLEVEPGRAYQFRYRLLKDGEELYLNDEHADGFAPNEFGTQNAFVVC